MFTQALAELKKNREEVEILHERIDSAKKLLSELDQLYHLLEQTERKEKKPSRAPAPRGKTKPKKGGGKSGYKGVKNCGKTASGRDRYSAQWYNPQTKKLEHLGTFDHELMAAAAWFDKSGDKDEASRLRELAKKQGASGRMERPGRNKIWICKHCRLEWKSKPESCPGCSGTAFEERTQ